MRLSLFWRTFALIGLLIAVSFAAWHQIYRVLEREPQASRFAWEIAAIVNLTRAALISSSGERRNALLIDLARNEGVRVFPLEPQDQVEPWPDLDVGLMAEAKLQELLGPRTIVAGRVNGERALWVSFEIEGDLYWLIADPKRLERQLGGNWLQITLIAVGLTLAGALLISRRVNRPLANLATAIDRLSRGESPARLAEDGPTEISTLNQRFNQLAGDLQAVEADREIVLAGVSHDIRTPLTRLRLEIEMSQLAAGAKDSMIEEIERIDQIVRQFIEFARPLELSVETVNIDQCVDGLLRGYARERDDGTVDARKRLERDLTWRGSPVVLQRILGNLIDNAIKYGRSPDDGCAHLDILGRRRGRVVELSIRDRGPGVPPESLERLLRPFARLDEAARGPVGGSGLGLAIVARLARRAGGSLVLDNALGGGLLARVTLKDQDPMPAESAPAAARSHGPRSPLPGPGAPDARSSSPSD